MDYHCPDCNKIIAKEDKRRKEGDRIRSRNKATLVLGLKQAPRIICTCGKVIIILKGSSQ